MIRKLIDPSSPLSVQDVAKVFRMTGWINLWSQVVLTVVSSGILIVAGFSSRAPVVNPTVPGLPVQAPPPNPSAGLGGLMTLVAILVLFFTIYWSFRYVVTGRQLKRDARDRPKRSQAIQLLQTGLLASLAGMLVGLLGTFAIVGNLAVIAFRQAPGFAGGSFTQFVNSLDILVVQASIMLILAHFIGAVSSLWLLNRISR